MRKIVLGLPSFVCAFVLQLLSVNAFPANMSDQEFTALTGSSVEDSSCVQSYDDEDSQNWKSQVAKIQLRVNVEKYTHNVIKKISQHAGVSSNEQKYRKIKIKLN